MKELDGKLALVTGSDQGIGKATAIELASRGANVIISCRPREDSKRRGLEVCDLIKKEFGVNAMLLMADLLNSGEIEDLVTVIGKGYNTLDILVNSAAMAKWRTIEDIEMEDMDYSYMINVRAALQLTKLCYPLMRNGGRIVNVSSCGTHVIFPSSVDYTSVKCALEGMSRALAVDLEKYNIMVNAICPGLADTRSLRILMRRPGMKEWIEWLKENFRQDVVMEPEEVAYEIANMCSFGRYITGCVSLFDKGLVNFMTNNPEAMDMFYQLTKK